MGVTKQVYKETSWSCLVDKWVGLALEHQVKHLHLYFQIFERRLYTLPETVFLAESITVLSLHRCKLDHPKFNKAFRFPALKKLKLVSVCLDEEIIEKLTSNSPLLEHIHIKHCSGFAYCRVPKLQWLTTFDISTPAEELESIEITAPNLRYCNLHCYELARPPRHVTLAECHNVRNLTLSGNNLIVDAEFQDIISKPPLLEELTLDFCNLLRKVKITNQELKHLEFNECDEVESIDIDTPNLLSFYFTGKQIPRTASINAPCPLQICFCPLKEVDTKWYLKLKAFLGTSNRIKWLSIDIDVDTHSFDLQEFIQSAPSRLCEISELHLAVIRLPESEYGALMDAYFTICCPGTLSVETENSNFYVWFYETLAERGVYSGNWQQYLKDIKIESFTGNSGVHLRGDALMNAWPNLPEGRVDLALEW